MTTLARDSDPFDVRRVTRTEGLLRDFNEAGVLLAADVHVALRLAELGGGRDESTTLAAAFAVRAPRLGHVYVDLETISNTATVDADEPVDLSALPWPVPAIMDRAGSRERARHGRRRKGRREPSVSAGGDLALP